MITLIFFLRSKFLNFNKNYYSCIDNTYDYDCSCTCKHNGNNSNHGKIDKYGYNGNNGTNKM